MMCRHQVLGNEVKIPAGPGTWKVQMLVNGKTTATDARLYTVTPLDFGRQHIFRESCHSIEFLDKPPVARHPERRQVLWVQRSLVEPGPFRASYEFYCAVDMRHPTPPMARLSHDLEGAPKPGEDLEALVRAGADAERITALARRLTASLERPTDQAEALFRYVDRDLDNEPSISLPATSAMDCLGNGGGDAGAKSRLLVALLRNRGIPARIVTGLTLSKGPEQLAHYWAEAWIHDRWVPMCPFYHHFGRVPPTYLVFGIGDLAMVHGRHVSDLDYAFLVERTVPEDSAAADPSILHRALLALSLYRLPPPEQRLVEFLLLLPIAALIVCVYRNLIGLLSFGTFAPALVGLAFRDLHSMPGIVIFVSIVLVGWVMRRVLDRFHLLQVPRTAFLLSLVVILLIGTIIAANFQSPPVPATQYVSLFPMVILTGMIERFWTLESEDSTSSSFRTLLGTMFIAATISLVLSLHAIVDHMFRYPETLGLIMATQLLIGRYTGYKFSELFRFRDFLRPAEA
jgi:hypothetical protein